MYIKLFRGISTFSTSTTGTTIFFFYLYTLSLTARRLAIRGAEESREDEPG
jgi:hypothetical protein